MKVCFLEEGKGEELSTLGAQKLLFRECDQATALHVHKASNLRTETSQNLRIDHVKNPGLEAAIERAEDPMNEARIRYA